MPRRKGFAILLEIPPVGFSSFAEDADRVSLQNPMGTRESCFRSGKNILASIGFEKQKYLDKLR